MTYREVRFRTESQQDIEGNDAPETGSQKLPSIVVQVFSICNKNLEFFEGVKPSSMPLRNLILP